MMTERDRLQELHYYLTELTYGKDLDLTVQEIDEHMDAVLQSKEVLSDMYTRAMMAESRLEEYKKNLKKNIDYIVSVSNRGEF